MIRKTVGPIQENDRSPNAAWSAFESLETQPLRALSYGLRVWWQVLTMPFAGLAVAQAQWAGAALLTFSLACAGQAAPAIAETPLDRAKRTDGLLYIPNDDPKMAAAFRKAQATLDGFLAIVRKPPLRASGFSVKIPLPVPGGGNEYIWVSPVRIEPDGRISGPLANRVVEAEGYREGQIVSVAQSEIVDWGYGHRGRLLGHFTTCVLMDREPDGERHKAELRLACEK